MKDPEDYDPEVDGEELVNTEPIEESEDWDDEPDNTNFLK